MVELVGQYNNKSILFLSGAVPTLHQDIEDLRPYFICTIFLHQQEWVETDLRRLLLELIRHGAVYFLFHGNKCERAHDIADEVHATILPEEEVTYDNVIGTDWFDDSSPDEVIFSAFCGSVPPDDYLERLSSFLVISIGTATENAAVRALITDVKSTINMAIVRPKNARSH